MQHSAKIVDFEMRRDHRKNSNELRVYESVDYGNLSRVTSRKEMKIRYKLIKHF